MIHGAARVACLLTVMLVTAMAMTTAACDKKKNNGDDDNGNPAAAMRPVIYQLVVRYFSNTTTTNTQNGTIQQNGCGKFNHITTTAINAIKDLGVTHIWLTGVLRQATMTDYAGNDPQLPDINLPADDPDIVKGRAGSFYAIRDYFDVCPDYAETPANRLQEFDALVARIHAAGLKVVIDLVPNHVARSYDSVVNPAMNFGSTDDKTEFFKPETNNFFYLVDPPGQALSLSRPASFNPVGVTFDGQFEPENGVGTNIPKVTGDNVTSASPSETSWYETIKLNYGHNFADPGTSSYDPIPDTWNKVDAIIEYWQNRGIDGFRCDFAHYVPVQAWSYLISRAKQRHPNVWFVAEAYDNLPGLLQNGMDVVYNDPAYDALKSIYQGSGTQADLNNVLDSLSDVDRPRYLHYLENHDERRIASPVVGGGNPDDSGFGSMNAGRQLAPLVYLYNSGPILFYNGQEVGEPGAGAEGFGGDDGRTTIFDYWAMPEFAKWVNNHAYDGGGSSAAQLELRAYYRDLLALAQDPSVRGGRYWGLEHHNETHNANYPTGFFAYARFDTASERAIVVVANFTFASSASGTVRLETDLADAIGLAAGKNYTVRLVLNETGKVDQVTGTYTRAELIADGFAATVGDQACNVYVIE